MTRRARGEGGLHWDERRERWIATVTVGDDGRGKRMVRKASGRTKTEAKTKLRELVRDRDDWLRGNGYTVRDAVEELVYRHQLRPGLQTGATVMDQLSNHRDESA